MSFHVSPLRKDSLDDKWMPVAIKVTNKLAREDITIHWHGLSQRGSPWMDGVPDVSQCPITPGQMFTYRFVAEPAGTHWYHSHVTGQHPDGLYGVFIVHKSSPILTEWPLMVGDWYHLEGHTIETINPGSVETEDKGSGGNFFASRFLRDYGVDNTPLTATIWTSALINGRGRFNNDSYPLTKFHVKHGNTYRFRMVNVGADFTLQVSIDSHPMLIVALDGHDIVPVETDYIMIAVGERVDFEIRANQTEGRYWLRAESPEDPKNRTAGHDVKAMLVYEHIPDDLDPTSQQMPCTSALKCRIFNCPFTAFPETYNMVCIHLTDVKSNQDAKTTASQYGVKDTNVQEVFFNVGASVNSKKFIVPSAPMFQEDSVTVPCETACLDMTKGCKCTNTVILLFNKTIQVIISNFQPAWHAGHHPMHIHGHSFTVVKIGFPIQNKTSGHYVGFNTDVLCDDNGRRCWSTQWTGSARSLTKVSNPVIKDTVVVPARGYVVLRFRARNPGFWLLHCHMNHHILNGMAVLLDEGVGYYPPPPDHFPTCHSFDMTKEQFSTYKMTYDNYFNGPGNLSFIVGTTPTPAPSNTNAPGTDLVCLPSVGYVILKTSDLIGGAVGCVLAGMVAAILPLMLYICCRRTNKN